MFNYHNITKNDMLNGDGLRVVLWFSGCEHACKNCQNKQTWSHKSGVPFDYDAITEIVEELNKDYVSGLTMSGGDPLSKQNREHALRIAKELKQSYPTKNIWVYTGYLWEDVKDLDGIEYIDIIVDGKYMEELNFPSPKWRGSSNQRVIDVCASLNCGDVIEYIK